MNADRILKQVDELTALAWDAFAVGNAAVGIAAITRAAQLVKLAKLLDPPSPSSRTRE